MIGLAEAKNAIDWPMKTSPANQSHVQLKGARVANRAQTTNANTPRAHWSAAAI